MNKENTAPQPQHQLAPIYQCPAEMHQMLRSVQEQLHRLCGQHANQLVRVETVHGDVFEGHLGHCDRGVLYLSLPNEGPMRAFFPGVGGFILPLVLYDLLAISLFI